MTFGGRSLPTGGRRLAVDKRCVILALVLVKVQGRELRELACLICLILEVE
jgi:hypothetical protein